MGGKGAGVRAGGRGGVGFLLPIEGWGLSKEDVVRGTQRPGGCGEGAGKMLFSEATLPPRSRRTISLVNCRSFKGQHD